MSNLKIKKKSLTVLLFCILFSFVYKLSDFGTAKQLTDDGMFQSLVGTEEYLASIYTVIASVLRIEKESLRETLHERLSLSTIPPPPKRIFGMIK